MSDDDDQLRRLLSDAVSDIEPRDRIAEIRASVRPDPQVVPMSRPRPWLYALSGAVASAAVIGVIAFTTNALSGPDDGSNGLGAGPAHSRHTTSPVRTATATDSATPPSSPSSPSTSPPAATTGAQAYAVYYVGANAAGRPVLYREWHRGPHLPAADPGGKGRDVLNEAVHDAMATSPLDADYRTPWRNVALLDYARVRVDRGRAHAADRSEEHRHRAASHEHDRRRGAGRRTAAGLHGPGCDREAGARRLHGRTQAARGASDASRRRHLPADRERADPQDALPRQHLLPQRGRPGLGEADGDRDEQLVRGHLGRSISSTTGGSTSSGRRSAGRAATSCTPGPSPSTRPRCRRVSTPSSRRTTTRRVRDTPRHRHPHARGQVGGAQRPVRDSSAATATTPAVEVRNTSSPRRTACAPAAGEGGDLVVGQPALGPDHHEERPAPVHVDGARHSAAVLVQHERPGRPTRDSAHDLARWWQGRLHAGEPRTPRLLRRLAGGVRQRASDFSARSPRHTATDRVAAHGTMVATPTSVSTSTASSPRSPLGSAWTTVTRGVGSGAVATSSTPRSAVACRSRSPHRSPSFRAPSVRTRRSPGRRRRVRRPRGVPRHPRPRRVTRVVRRPATRPSGPGAHRASSQWSLNASRMRPKRDCSRPGWPVGLLLAPDRCQLAQQLLLARVEPGRGVDLDRDDEVASTAAQSRDPTAPEDVLASRLRAGREIELEGGLEPAAGPALHVGLERGQREVGAEGGRRHRHRHRAVQGRAVAGEDVVRRDVPAAT